MPFEFYMCSFDGQRSARPAKEMVVTTPKNSINKIIEIYNTKPMHALEKTLSSYNIKQQQQRRERVWRATEKVY